jgi:hypothetical protein
MIPIEKIRELIDLREFMSMSRCATETRSW